MLTCRVCGRETKTATCAPCYKWASNFLSIYLFKASIKATRLGR
jgi:hypothetical protein